MKTKTENMSIASAALAASLLLFANFSTAQANKDVVGTWILVSGTAEVGGTKTQPYGANPLGMMTLSESGRYSTILLRSDLPKFASNNRTTGTLEENKEVVKGSISHFGTYSVEGNQLVFRVEGSSFSNWNGIEQKRPFTVSTDQLTYVVPSASGGGTSQFTWKKAK